MEDLKRPLPIMGSNKTNEIELITVPSPDNDTTDPIFNLLKSKAIHVDFPDVGTINHTEKEADVVTVIHVTRQNICPKYFDYLKKN